jgi:hypothetical protein
MSVKVSNINTSDNQNLDNNLNSEESIIKLKRYTTFKRDKSFSLYCYGDYTIVDGLN